MTKELESIIGNSEYIILKNGEILEGSLESLDFSKSVELKLIHIIDKNVDLNINIKEGSNVHLEEVFYDVKEDVTINLNINCLKDSYLKYLSFKTNNSGKICVNVNISLYENAYIENKNITSFLGEAEYKQNICLEEKNSRIESMDVVINNSGKVQKFNLDTYHNVGDSFSTMKNFCISKNESVIYMNTNGKITKGSANSDLSQKTKGLILDEASQISANPLLLIDEYDCLASHGASIGAIDEEELYYLMSRGLTRSDSERLIVEGFVYPFTSELKDEKIRTYVLSLIKKII